MYYNWSSCWNPYQSADEKFKILFSYLAHSALDMCHDEVLIHLINLIISRYNFLASTLRAGQAIGRNEYSAIKAFFISSFFLSEKQCVQGRLLSLGIWLNMWVLFGKCQHFISKRGIISKRIDDDPCSCCQNSDNWNAISSWMIRWIRGDFEWLKSVCYTSGATFRNANTRVMPLACHGHVCVDFKSVQCTVFPLHLIQKIFVGLIS